MASRSGITASDIGQTALTVVVSMLVVTSMIAAVPIEVSGAPSGNMSTPGLTTGDEKTEYVLGSDDVVVAPNLRISGTGTIDGARVLIDNKQSGDTLLIDDSSGSTAAKHGISGTYDSNTGVLELTGTAPLEEYEAVLQTVRFKTTQGTNTGTRDVTFSLGTNLPYSDNGHYYEFVPAGEITWTEARDKAAGKSYFGLQGYLATITSEGEDKFVQNKLQGEGWIGASDSASEGTWRWVTGPEGEKDGGAGLRFFTQTASVSGEDYNGNTPGGGNPVQGRYNDWDDPSDAIEPVQETLTGKSDSAGAELT